MEFGIKIIDYAIHMLETLYQCINNLIDCMKNLINDITKMSLITKVIYIADNYVLSSKLNEDDKKEDIELKEMIVTLDEDLTPDYIDD